ncbi:MAG: transporter substrate-binding domain-containing protein [Aestuariivirga sp.]
MDKTQAKPEVALPSKIILLADDDFAPFSFKSIDGKSAGISIQLALSSCALLKITCDVKLLPYASLMQALASKQGDVIVGGPSATSLSGQALRTTRPYYLSFSRFIKRVGVNFAGTDAKSLAGRRLGVVKGTAQEEFLKKNFGRSSLITFDNTASLFETLRTGGVDLAFADSTLSAFWLKGENARGCCATFGGAFMDRATITRSLVMVMRQQDANLQSAFDYALDQLQENGSTAKVFQTYLPESPF